MLKLTNRATLYILLLLAPFLWGGLLLFTRFIPPHTILAFIAFFISLRFLSSRLSRTTVRHALRQGALLSLCVILNLILLSLHSWNIFAAIIIFAAAIVIEVVSLAKK